MVRVNNNSINNDTIAFQGRRSILSEQNIPAGRALDNFWGQVPIPSERGILHHFKTKRGILSHI